MSITLANALRKGLPTIEEDLYKKCDSSKYYLDLSMYKYRDKDAVVYDQKTNYDIILCLYYNKKCISSVVGRYHASDSSMEILSTTQSDFENKKFNLYLRIAFVYLMCFVRPTIKNILSFSVNPISTYTMFKYFHASNTDLDEFITKNKLTPPTFTVENARQFHEFYRSKHRMTKEQAEDELDDMTEDHSLEEFGWGSREEALKFIMADSNTVHTITLSVPLSRPGLQDFLLHTLANIAIGCGEIRQASSKKTVSKERTKKRRRTSSRSKRSKSSSRSREP
jgi:hypothetical protein